MLGFLTSRIAGPIAAGLSLILAITLAATILSKNATIGELRGQLTTVRLDLKNAEADLTQCQSNRITLEEATARQNAAVEAVRAESGRRVQTLTVELDKAHTATAAAEARSKAILSRPAPSGDQCKAADALIMELVQ